MPSWPLGEALAHDFSVYVMTNHGRPDLLARTLDSLRQSDVGTDFSVFSHPPRMAFLDFFVACFEAVGTDRRYVVQIEDDVVVNQHLLHNLRNWTARRDPQFGVGYGFVSQGVAGDRGRQARSALGIYRSCEFTHGSCLALVPAAEVPALCAAMRARMVPKTPPQFGGDLLLSGAVWDWSKRVYLHEPALAETDIGTSSIRCHPVTPDHAAQDNFHPRWRSPGCIVPVRNATGDWLIRSGTIDEHLILANDEYGLDSLPARPTVVDAGAHIGTVARRVLRLRPNATVAAGEMDPVNVDLLRSNTWSVRDRVTVVEAALVGKPRELRVGCLHGPYNTVGHFVEQAGAAGRGSVFDQRQNRPALLAQLTLADIVERCGDIDLLKLDIEGCEFDVLTNAGRRLFGRIGAVAMEVNPWAMPGGGVQAPVAMLRACYQHVEIQKHDPANLREQFMIRAAHRTL